MVICAIIGCSNRSGRDKVRFFRLPAVVKHQGEQMFSIMTQQRCAWLKAISRDDLTEAKLSNVFVCEMHFVYRKYAILGRKTVYCRYELFTGKPAYHMNTFDVDWSPTVDLGHNKIDGDKLKDMQERADRAISRKRKREDEEFEAQMMEQELMEQECHIDDEAQNDKACHKETETEHKGDLPFDFFDEAHFTNDDHKVCYYTGLPNREMLLSIFELVIPLPGLKKEYFWRSYLITSD